MDWKVKFITKKVFNKVKFITDQLQLQDYKKRLSIGYLFFYIMQQHHKETIVDVKGFWDSAKKIYIQQSMKNTSQYKMQSNQYGSICIMCVS